MYRSLPAGSFQLPEILLKGLGMFSQEQFLWICFSLNFAELKKNSQQYLLDTTGEIFWLWKFGKYQLALFCWNFLLLKMRKVIFLQAALLTTKWGIVMKEIRTLCMSLTHSEDGSRKLLCNEKFLCYLQNYCSSVWDVICLFMSCNH